MSNNKERKIPDYLKFPFERYIMVRVEFLILTQSELEAKIMRIIEWAIESRRDELSRKGEDIPDEVWVTIPESIFMEWLYGTVQSDTTFKAAIKSLIKKHLIFKRPSGPGRYDALEYTLNKPLISKLFTLFPEKINDVDMTSIMKQPRKSNKESEGQLLHPSIIDPLIKRIRGTIIDPLNSQLLHPSASIIAPLTELERGPIIAPKKEREETKKESKKESDLLSPSHPSLSLSEKSARIAQLVEEARRLEEEIQQAASESLSNIGSSTAENGNAPTSPQVRRTDELDPARLADVPELDEQRARGYWRQLGYIEKSGSQKHWKPLAEHTKSFEQFKSLFDYTQRELEKDPKITNKEVNPGNMVKQVTGWKQEEERKRRLAEPVKITRSKEDPLAKYKDIASRFMNQGVN